MNSEKTDLFDVLSALDSDEQPKNTYTHPVYTKPTTPIVGEVSDFSETSDFVILDDSALFFEDAEVENPSQEDTLEHTIKQEVSEKKSKILPTFVFLCKYISTSALIFVVLLFTTNYSAYYNIAMSTIFQKDFEKTSQGLLSSVEASSLSEPEPQEEEVSVSLESATLEIPEETFNSIETLAAQAKRAEVDLGITITPYENRVVIPKIGKNIPLIDITQQKVTGIDELNDIFMEELENGVIRYPGSAKPGQEGNTFVFGHSSNFPWMEGDYNDVFSLLDKVVFDDEVIVYYDQKKYIYKIRTKEVIKPGDVSILKRDKGKSEITLMTCWPIGTTLNRLILIGELVEIR